MIDDHFDALRIENPILAPLLQIHDRRRCRNLVAENGIQPQHMNIPIRADDAVFVRYFLGNGFPHGPSMAELQSDPEPTRQRDASRLIRVSPYQF